MAKKAKCQRTDAFILWCRIRLLRVPWTTRRSNQSFFFFFKFSNYLFSTQAKTLRPPQSFPPVSLDSSFSSNSPKSLSTAVTAFFLHFLGTASLAQTFLILLFGSFFRSKSHSLKVFRLSAFLSGISRPWAWCCRRSCSRVCLMAASREQCLRPCLSLKLFRSSICSSSLLNRFKYLKNKMVWLTMSVWRILLHLKHNPQPLPVLLKFSFSSRLLQVLRPQTFSW